MTSTDSFGAKGTLDVGGTSYEVFRLSAVDGAADLPYSLKVLLENLLRTEDGADITADHVRALAAWDPAAEPDTEIQYTPARVLMQDFTGVPCVVDLAAMREAMADLGGDPRKINPLAPAELVIDHSVVADYFGTTRRPRPQRRAGVRAQPRALRVPQVGPDRVQRLRRRAAEHRHRPPGQPGAARPRRLHPRARRRDAGLPGHPGRHRQPHHDDQRPGRARLGRRRHRGRGRDARPAGLDAHPAGRRLQARRRAAGRRHRHRPGAHRHRAAAQARRRRQVRRVLRPRRGQRAARRPRHHRQHEPGVRLHLRDLPDRRRDAGLPAPDRPPRASWSQLVEAYAKEQGLWHDPSAEPRFSETLELDLATVVPSLAGPKRPQDRVPLDRRQGDVPHRAGRLRDHGGAGATARSRGTTDGGIDEASDESLPGHRPGRGVREQARRPAASASTSATVGDRPSNPVPADAGRRRAGRARPRRGRDRRDHQLHQHHQPLRHGRRRPARQGRRREGPDQQAVGQDHPGARVARSSPTTTSRPASRPTSTSWASRPSATAARPASATAARCPRRSAPRSTRATSPWSRCCRATATSRAASTPTSR